LVLLYLLLASGDLFLQKLVHVSRQYEEEYYRYYGWPYYWQGETSYLGKLHKTKRPLRLVMAGEKRNSVQAAKYTIGWIRFRRAMSPHNPR
jgi:hypothetical protein